MARFTGDSVTFDNSDPTRYVGDFEPVTTDGVVFDVSVRNIDTSKAKLVINITKIKQVSGAVFKFILNGSEVKEETASTVGEITHTVTGLNTGSDNTFTAEEYRDTELKKSKSTQFTTLSESSNNVVYETKIEIDSSDNFNSIPLISAIETNSGDEINSFELVNSSGTSLFSSTDQLTQTVNDNRLKNEIRVYSPQTSDADNIESVILNGSSNYVTLPVNDAGGKRYYIVIPIKSQ